MSNNDENLQYNSCISRGICSVNPRTSALQNVLWLYLRMCAKYCIKLTDQKAVNDYVRNFILNTINIAVANPQFTENCFIQIVSRLRTILPDIINEYNSVFQKNDFGNENILESDIFLKCKNIVDAIKLGEHIFRSFAENIPAQTRDLFKIMMLIAKSISLNLLDLESYGIRNDEAFLKLLNLINSTDAEKYESENLKNVIYDSAESNTTLMDMLHSEQEKRYGRQKIARISYTTTPSKAVLVVGSNIKELENILEALKNTDIDIYTHDDMMVAHTFPKFSEYKNLKSQYGHGIENCLIDFATFPGPIILTKHSLHNIENLYRGRLFTTDTNFYKGVIQIENSDFSRVIESANMAKGFKRGKICETVTVGYDYEKSIELIEQKLKSGNYKKNVIIGLKDYTIEKKNYFEKLIKYLSDETLIISFSYSNDRDNLLSFNTCFDSYAVVRITQYLLNKNLPLNIFLPKCGRNTITEMIHFAKYEKNTVYMDDCEPIMINPSLSKTLTELFNIKSIEDAKKDSEMINKL